MIRAILENRKSQTRRTMNPQPSWEFSAPDNGVADWYSPTMVDKRSGETYPGKEVFGVADENEGYVSKYGIPGDRFWVRETFRLDTRDGQFFYCASSFHPERFSWKPSIFMPRKASRITLEITGVRVERLNDISDLDACAEGADGPHPTFQAGDVGEDGPESFIAGYREIWETINGVNSWEKNPWVWVLEFRKTT
jgi:hypothetical protein